MKNSKAILLSAMCIALVVTVAITGCKKEGTSDLTTDIVGHFTSGSGSAAVDIIVTKIDNSTISITIDPAAGSTVTFATTHMNSATSFSLNNTSLTFSSTRTDYSGSGSYSANNIVIQTHQKSVDIPTGNTNSEIDHTYSGLK